MNVSHTYIGDLVISLDTPDNSFVMHDQSGGGIDDLQKTLSIFTTTVAGEWKMTVKDLAGDDIGTLNTFSLTCF